MRKKTIFNLYTIKNPSILPELLDLQLDIPRDALQVIPNQLIQIHLLILTQLALINLRMQPPHLIQDQVHLLAVLPDLRQP